MKRTFLIVIICFIIFPLNLTPDTKKTQEDLNEESILAVLWYQNSAEMRALCYQAFNLATKLYNEDLKENKSGKKRAVVVDIYETVIDNSPFQAGLIGTNNKYNNALWQKWCNAKKAEALPGAIDFLNHVNKHSGEVFYITNRKSIKEEIDLKQATIDNLKSLGFPCVDEKHIKFQTDQFESSKESRINKISNEYRIVLIIGDNLNDFHTVFETKNLNNRINAVDKNEENFGKKFIALPNPMYGAWETGLYSSGSLTPQEKNDKRKKALKKFVDKRENKFNEAIQFIEKEKKKLKEFNLSVSTGLGGHAAGENNLYKMDFSADASKGIYPDEFRLMAGTDLQIKDNELTENVTTLLINYDHHFLPWLETYAFIERFSNSYLSIQHRYEIGTGLKFEFDFGNCSEKCKEHLDLLDDNETKESDKEYDDLKSLVDIKKRVTKFKKDEHETVTALKKKYARFSFGLAVTVFTEMEKASIKSEIEYSNDDVDAQEDCESEEFPLPAEQRYRFVLRPSFKFRPSDSITLRGQYYWKLPLGDPYRYDKYDYRTDLIINATFAIPSSKKWAKNMSLIIEFQRHYDNCSPQIPDETKEEYAAQGKTLKTEVAENTHYEMKFKFQIKF